MGADLYMNKGFEKREKKFAKQIQEALDKTKDDPDDKVKHQKAIDLYDDLYSSDVYFRDSYNSGNLLWSLGLSWWEDVTELMDEQGDLHPLQIQKLINMVESKTVNVSNDFQKSMPDDWGEGEALNYFEESRESLIKFLKKAIDTNDSIGCSV